MNENVRDRNTTRQLCATAKEHEGGREEKKIKERERKKERERD